MTVHDSSQKEMLGRLQNDVGDIRERMARQESATENIKSDVGEIKSSISAIMQGYVPINMYKDDQKELKIRVKTLETALAEAKPGIDLSNGIVQQLMRMFIGAVIGGAIIYLWQTNKGGL